MSIEINDYLTQFGKEYLSSLLEILELYYKNKTISTSLYGLLKKKYTTAYEKADNKSVLRDGFVKYQAINPDLDTIQFSIDSFNERLQKIDDNKKEVQDRIIKVRGLMESGNISESTYRNKIREYELLTQKLDEEKKAFLKEVPQLISVINQLDEIVKKNIEEIEVETSIKNKSKLDLESEKKRLQKNHKTVLAAIRKLSELSSLEISESSKLESISTTKYAQIPPTVESSYEELPSPKEAKSGISRDFFVTWKGITIGKFIGELNLVGTIYGIIATDRPSLSIIKDIAQIGPTKLRGTTNLVEIENRLRKLIADTYKIREAETLYPENLIKYIFENKVGIDILKLINSYYAAVPISAIENINRAPKINDSIEVLTLAEITGLLGRRVLAPDRSLIGVIHELYLDPTTLHLYAFSFKGVPPQVIKKIYTDIYNLPLSEGNFGEFRNDIAKKLSVPIYEALTPSSILRYVLISGLVTDLSQLITITESMIPRISKNEDIASISSQGILLSRFPQNSLPRIQFLEY